MTTQNRDLKIGSLPPFGLRLPPGLKRKVEEAARRNGRSLNAEITSRLEQTLLAEGDTASDNAAKKLVRMGIEGDPLEKRLTELEGRVAKLEK
jgi:plasmid stability protein